MKKNSSFTLIALTCLLAVIITSSCSRKITGFSYQSKVKAPDVAEGNSIKGVNEQHISAENKIAEPIVQYNGIQLTEEPAIEIQKKEKLNQLNQIASEEFTKLEQQNRDAGITAPVSAKQLVKNMADQMIEKGVVKDISEKKMKNLEKMASKWEKKKQLGKENFLGSGNMLLFAIIALGGLVLGIFVTWVGWLIFVVFGGIWLYKKLEGE